MTRADCQSQCQCDCGKCTRFTPGDRIELNVTGILVMGGRMVDRGTVLGQAKIRKGIVIKVNWDSLPSSAVAMVPPKHIQKLYDQEKAFI